MELMEIISESLSDERNDKEKYCNMAKMARESGMHRVAGILEDIAHEEWTHAELLEHILDEEWEK